MSVNSGNKVHAGWVQPPAPAIFEAHWKPVIAADPAFAASCGKPGCPGFLGTLVLYDMREFAQRWTKYGEALDRDDIEEGDANFRAFVEARFTEANSIITHALYVRHARGETAPEDGDHKMWVLVPFRVIEWRTAAKVMRVHTGARPIYFGSTGRGYRISLTGGGRRQKKTGRRTSRRRAEPRTADEARTLAQTPGLASHPFGESPVLPCTVWCPACDSLNVLNLPDGALTYGVDGQAL